MDKKSAVLFAVMFCLSCLSVAATFFNGLYLQNFAILEPLQDELTEESLP
jgi:hypothetical protein